jgi:hypothetical protein
MTPTAYFSTDRAVKYGWGLLRLFLLCILAFELAPRLSAGVTSVDAARTLGLVSYLKSGRWFTHAYIGSIGAVVNVEVLGFISNLAMLFVAALLIIWDLRLDYSILVYMCKTFSGDFIAGKLDSTEWRLVLAFTCSAATVAWRIEATGSKNAFEPYSRILPVLALIQLICELGDKHFEHWMFFRHRYSFELLNVAVLFGMALTPVELAPVQYDLIVCLFYRATNAVIILIVQSGGMTLVLNRLAFRAFGCLKGMRLELVTDTETAMAVLRASSVKGRALERLIASPAWSPLLSLESIDGPLYHLMIADFHTLLSVLPNPATLIEIAKGRMTELLNTCSGLDRPIDAEAIATLSVLCFVRYLFGTGMGSGRDQPPQKECLHGGNRVFVQCTEDEESFFVQKIVQGSWEWRKEIAVRGKARVDVKSAAIEALLTLLKGSDLWSLHGENWHKPRFYSLLMQPFLISPAINLGDIAVAMKLNPKLSATDAVRAEHPFPIFERFVGNSGVRRHDRSLAIKPNTQVIMFSMDFAGSFPIFGAGPRSCVGASFAQPLINLIDEMLRPHALFQPQLGHRYSGRNNDSIWSLSESIYRIKKVASVLFLSENAVCGKALLQAEMDAQAEVTSAEKTQ